MFSLGSKKKLHFSKMLLDVIFTQHFCCTSKFHALSTQGESNNFNCVCVYIYIYIYIYISHPQTDCFIVSQLIGVTRHTRRFKLGLKLSWLHSSRISYCRASVNLSISKGIFTYCFCLNKWLNAQFIWRALHYI